MRRSKEDAEATREALLCAAEQLLAEKGIKNTRLEDVAAAVGVTRGAIYWHFKNKEELINAILERLRDPLNASMGELVERAAKGKFCLEELITALIHPHQQLSENPATEQLIRFAVRYALCRESEALSERIDQDREDNLQRMTRLMHLAQQLGQVRQDIPPEQLALYVRSHVMGVFHHQLAVGNAFGSGMDSIRTQFKLMIAGLRPPNQTTATSSAL